MDFRIRTNYRILMVLRLQKEQGVKSWKIKIHHNNNRGVQQQSTQHGAKYITNIATLLHRAVPMEEREICLGGSYPEHTSVQMGVYINLELQESNQNICAHAAVVGTCMVHSVEFKDKKSI
eukprot:1775673-Ditylum_brightwellii.AAC.1